MKALAALAGALATAAACYALGSGIAANMFAALSEGVEMLYVPAFAIGRHSAAALLHFTFLLVLAMLVCTYGKRIGKPLAGAAAALLVYASPVVGIDGTTAYIDVA